MLRLRPMVAAVLVAASPAHAGPRRSPPVQLVYTRGAGAEACPEVEALRRAVVAEMGDDPFLDDGPPPPPEAGPAGGDPQTPGRLRVSIERRAGQLEAGLEMRDGAGQ